MKRLIAAGKAGVGEAQTRLGAPGSDEDEENRANDEMAAHDAPKAAIGLAGEDAGREALRRVGIVTKADLMLDLGGEAGRQTKDTLKRVLINTRFGDGAVAAFRPVVAKSITRLVDVDGLVLPRAVGL